MNLIIFLQKETLIRKQSRKKKEKYFTYIYTYILIYVSDIYQHNPVIQD